MDVPWRCGSQRGGLHENDVTFSRSKREENKTEWHCTCYNGTDSLALLCASPRVWTAHSWTHARIHKILRERKEGEEEPFFLYLMPRSKVPRLVLRLRPAVLLWQHPSTVPSRPRQRAAQLHQQGTVLFLFSRCWQLPESGRTFFYFLVETLFSFPNFTLLKLTGLRYGDGHVWLLFDVKSCKDIKKRVNSFWRVFALYARCVCRQWIIGSFWPPSFYWNTLQQIMVRN